MPLMCYAPDKIMTDGRDRPEGRTKLRLSQKNKIASFKDVLDFDRQSNPGAGTLESGVMM